MTRSTQIPKQFIAPARFEAGSRVRLVPWWLVFLVVGGLALAATVGLFAPRLLPYTACLEGLAHHGF